MSKQISSLKREPITDPFKTPFQAKSQAVSGLIRLYNQLLTEAHKVTISARNTDNELLLSHDIAMCDTTVELKSALLDYFQKEIEESIVRLEKEGIVNVNIPGLPKAVQS